ncbi:MAG TPA: hypothetical protein VMR28_02630 [Candidatus Saccharimonadales bacterium]|nr:hypothetical protein [Candidatus Saccharimonadales bacterium]
MPFDTKVPTCKLLFTTPALVTVKVPTLLLEEAPEDVLVVGPLSRVVAGAELAFRWLFRSLSAGELWVAIPTPTILLSLSRWTFQYTNPATITTTAAATSKKRFFLNFDGLGLRGIMLIF